jgi:hypothetical protein
VVEPDHTGVPDRSQVTTAAGQNVTMTAPEPRTRRCAACGYRFRPDGDELFCSGICAGQPSLWSLIFAAQQAARIQGPRR